jgi:hypothetical protein
MTGDAADYCADSSARYRTGYLPRARAAGGLADTEAGARADQRAGGRAVNGAPTQLALLRASAEKQRDASHRRQ